MQHIKLRNQEYGKYYYVLQLWGEHTFGKKGYTIYGYTWYEQTKSRFNRLGVLLAVGFQLFSAHGELKKTMEVYGEY